MSETEQGMPQGGTESAKKEVQGVVSQLEALLDEYLVEKAPFSLPDNAKEFIVKMMPYLIILFALMAIPAILVGLGISALLAPFALVAGVVGGGFGFFGLFGVIIALISFVVEVMAVKGLFGRTKHGWRLAFYASLIGLVGNIVSFNILNGILGAIIGWYFLFQVKEKYTK